MLPALAPDTSWAKHNPPTEYRLMVKHATRTLLESDDGVMRSAAIVIDGEHYDEWTCLHCGASGKEPSLSSSRYSQARSQLFLSWIRQHYPYNDNHCTYELWEEVIAEAVAIANARETEAPRDDFGQPFVIGLNVPSADEIAFNQDRKNPLPIIEATGRETESSGIVLLPVPAPPPPAPGKRGSAMTTPASSVTFYDVDPEKYAALLAVNNGTAPAPAASEPEAEKPAKEKKAKKEKAEKSEAPADDAGSGEGDEPEERKVYTEKALTKLGEADRANLIPIAEALNVEHKNRRVPKLIELILAAQIEANEAAADDGAVEGKGKDSDDFKEAKPDGKKGKKEKAEKPAKGKDKKKKGKKG